jgi:hypothetical protein
MKHVVGKSGLWLGSVVYLVYLIWLFMMDAVLVRPEYAAYNLLAYGLIVGVTVFFTVAVIKESLLPNNRRWVALVGILLIMCAHLYLMDAPDAYIFTADVTKVFGVFLVITWPTKMLISPKGLEKRAMKNVEIIEV